jgi:sortase A
VTDDGLRSHRRRWVAIAVSLAIVGGACATTAAVWNRDDGEPAAAATTTSTEPTTTTRPPTTTTVTLPSPDAPPADPYASVPVTQIGSIEIPKIGLSHPIFEGVWLTVVDHGPGHWPGTAMPGGIGNATFAGHRVTHSHPFLNLDQVAVGDEVIFHMMNGDFTYRVSQTLIVSPDALWISDQTAQRTMTLFACHPKHSAAQRIVVKGDLVASTTKEPAA